MPPNTSLLEPSNRCLIGHLRITCESAEAIPAQHRVERLLGATDLHPPSLPPTAILCVRRWCGLLSTSRAWADKLREDMDDFARRATRPSLEPVAPTSSAVIFADEAEMLACLGLDWLSGALRTHWWWSALLRNRDPGPFVLSKWAESPQLVPAALELMARAGQAGAFVSRLPQKDAAQILDNLLLCHGIELRSRPQNSEKSKSGRPFTAPPIQVDARSLFSPKNTLRHIPEPWLPWVPEASSPAPSLIAKMLLGCALLIRRSPATMRSQAFQLRLADWRCSALAEERHLALLQEDELEFTSTNRSAEISRPQNLAAKNAARESKSSLPRNRREMLRAQEAPLPTIFSEQLDVASLLPESLNVAKHVASIEVRNSETSVLSPEIAQPLRVEAEESPGDCSCAQSECAQVEVQRPAECESHALTRVVETRFGGLFFLLNVALLLEIYRDFTAPVENLELLIWDFLGLMGLEFCDREELQSDEIWKVLAQLAGRSELEPPGHYFHPQGSTLEDWVAQTSSRIRETVKAALDRNDGPEFLCRIPARVAQTHVRLDVYFSLKDHPIAIRMAGFDRDPGWIPAAARYVAYHFD